MRAYNKLRRQLDPEFNQICLHRSRMFKEHNKERMSESRKAYYSRNKVKEKENYDRWRKANPERIADLNRAYVERNRDALLERTRKRQAVARKTPEAREKARIRASERASSDPQYRLRSTLRCRLRSAIKAQGGAKPERTLNLVGCSWEHLQLHLESLFKPGMTWGNFGLWHVDHKTPLSLFDLTDADELRAGMHFTNLQPLWGPENIRKGAKLEWSESAGEGPPPEGWGVRMRKDRKLRLGSFEEAWERFLAGETLREIAEAFGYRGMASIRDLLSKHPDYLKVVEARRKKTDIAWPRKPKRQREESELSFEGRLQTWVSEVRKVKADYERMKRSREKLASRTLPDLAEAAD